MKKINNRVKITCIFFLAILAGVWIGTSKLFNNSKASEEFSIIPIAMALDDNYLYPTLVSMTSILENAELKTKYNFYIMHPTEFKEENKTKLKSLENKYEKCKIHTIDMGDKYKHANDRGHITTPAYYRLSLSELLPDLDKILWIDGDTLTFKDLTEMYNLNMDGIYYRGFIDPDIYGVKEFKLENNQGICDGVMVINLEKLREDDMVSKFEQFIIDNNEELRQHDQTVINVLCHEKNGILPPKFGMFNYYGTAEDAKTYCERLVGENAYTPEEMYDGFNDLALVHCVCKPWVYFFDVSFGSTWWDYAKKTDFYNEIAERYKFFQYLENKGLNNN